MKADILDLSQYRKARGGQLGGPPLMGISLPPISSSSGNGSYGTIFGSSPTLFPSSTPTYNPSPTSGNVAVIGPIQPASSNTMQYFSGIANIASQAIQAWAKNPTNQVSTSQGYAANPQAQIAQSNANAAAAIAQGQRTEYPGGVNPSLGGGLDYLFNSITSNPIPWVLGGVILFAWMRPAPGSRR